MNSQFLKKAENLITRNYKIDKELFSKLDVKRGLRNADGSGVLAGLTKVSGVVGFKKIDQRIEPVDGRLLYRGINIKDIVDGVQAENRFGYPEVVFLLLFGQLPNSEELKEFESYLGELYSLSERFISSALLNMPSSNVMNQIQRTVLALYTLDENPDDITPQNVLRQCLSLIAKFPALIAYAYQAKNFYFNGKTLTIRPPDSKLSPAENFLRMLREDGSYTPLEAELLDLALILHAEHGGGNNSAFSMHVLSSSHTDTYAATAGAISALKGPLHGAANLFVMNMMANIKENVKDWADEDEVSAYIEKIIRKKAHNRAGLIYGMGHAVYTKSDPRAVILKQKARSLAKTKGRLDEFQLYENIEKLTPAVFARVKNSNKVISPNVDFYSGFVYDMLGFPVEIYPPIFAMARITGWSAHRLEELMVGGRIIRPAYKSVAEIRDYIPLKDRK